MNHSTIIEREGAPGHRFCVIVLYPASFTVTLPQPKTILPTSAVAVHGFRRRIFPLVFSGDLTLLQRCSSSMVTISQSIPEPFTVPLLDALPL
ncbi:MAG TPA: hypothetical protein VEI57_05210 [Nitrospirota bacterium]|nr:hypothetical protein [Nitrospirota bacterium]